MSVYDLIPGAKAEGRILGYHFVDVDEATGNIKLRCGTVVADSGAWLPETEPVMCSSGYHASERLKDALSYAPSGKALCIVEMPPSVERGSDKMVARTRRVLARIDVHSLLAVYAEDCAADFAKRGIDVFMSGLEAAIAAGDRARVKELLDGAPDMSDNGDELFARFERTVESAFLSTMAGK
jgi:hypothetical protein